MNTIRVLSPGLFSTFQDGGRKGFRKYGVPLSGAMDGYSAALANRVLNNADDTPVLEITLQGPTLQFNCATAISIVGADISPKLNDKSIDLNKIIEIKTGDQLSFGKLIYGCRCYLAIKDGVEIKNVLNSCSYYPGISDENILKTEMVFKVREYKNRIEPNATVKIYENHFSGNLINVQRGPEFEWLSKQQQDLLFENDFSVNSKNNRMGYQLDGDPIKIGKDSSMLTAVTIPGTVQLTPAGNLIVLMRDCQTTGGYPRVLQLTESGINRLAQKKTNDSIKFQIT